ncbi:PIN domain-containing protein [Microbacterium sp. VKM Ac-2923]|uniref:PIN domain-containing protein n=1 Tax=Microbacterium sp. VKM Ac-2923 TaxID=2929476 RepID=UPI001FB347DB|nr:PIN domain-containing protein [Microbacterium sp. VKM Ac-2923]MCJ1706516.1 PIN domain-containing protein [Microbacterium sp. VKM Ac-2923]
MSSFTAFLDACVLVPIAPCDTLLRMADCGAFRPLWSERVEEEALRALCEIHPDIDPSRFHSRFRSMNEAFEDARVTGWETLVEGLELPDPNDRHVLAAAIRGRADVIVTENVRDFPASALSPLGLEAVRLDEFLLTQFDLGVPATVQIVHDQARAMGRPPVTAEQLLGRLARSGAPRFAHAVEAALSSPQVSDQDLEDSGR